MNTLPGASTGSTPGSGTGGTSSSGARMAISLGHRDKDSLKSSAGHGYEIDPIMAGVRTGVGFVYWNRPS
jgi:hypothetical protein